MLLLVEMPAHFNPLFPYGKRRHGQPDLPCKTDFNPLFPYGKRRQVSLLGQRVRGISIHSSHTGRDLDRAQPVIPSQRFQSTLPIREETEELGISPRTVQFQSTLPIREETPPRPEGGGGRCYFNPLFPYGKRRQSNGQRPTPRENFNPLFPYGKRLSPARL